jgi:hypothetical protein
MTISPSSPSSPSSAYPVSSVSSVSSGHTNLPERIKLSYDSAKAFNAVGSSHFFEFLFRSAGSKVRTDNLSKQIKNSTLKGVLSFCLLAPLTFPAQLARVPIAVNTIIILEKGEKILRDSLEKDTILTPDQRNLFASPDSLNDSKAVKALEDLYSAVAALKGVTNNGQENKLKNMALNDFIKICQKLIPPVNNENKNLTFGGLATALKKTGRTDTAFNRLILELNLKGTIIPLEESTYRFPKV